MQFTKDNLETLHDLWKSGFLTVDQIVDYLSKKDWLLGHISNDSLSLISVDKKTKFIFQEKR